MRNLIQKPLFILIATIITLFFLISLRKTASKSLVSQRNVELLEDKLQDINQRIELEKSQLDSTSSEFIKEKIIRDELLLQKPGEYVLQIPLEYQQANNYQPVTKETALQAWKKLFKYER